MINEMAKKQLKTEKHLCSTCCSGFLSKHELKLHTSLVHHESAGTSDMKSEPTQSPDSYNEIVKAETSTTHETSSESTTNINVNTKKKTNGRQFICSICDIKLSSSSHLNRHEKNVHCQTKIPEKVKRKSYTCEICQLSFFNSSNLLRHKRRIHSHQTKNGNEIRAHTKNLSEQQRKARRCEGCETVFYDEFGLRRHKRRVLANGKHCGTSLQTGSGASCLMNKKSGEKCEKSVVQCSVCFSKCLGRNSLKNHIVKYHPMEKWTDVLNSSINGKSVTKVLEPSVEKGNSDLENVCNIYERDITSSESLSAHVKEVHSKSKTANENNDNIRDMTNNSEVTKEKPSKTKTKPYCNICEKQFSSTNSLNRHKHRFHSSTQTPTHTKSKLPQCTICERTYKDVSTLKKHMRKVHGTSEDTSRRHTVSGLPAKGTEKNSMIDVPDSNHGANINKDMNMESTDNHTGDTEMVKGTCGPVDIEVNHADRPLELDIDDDMDNTDMEADIDTDENQHAVEKRFLCAVCSMLFESAIELIRHKRLVGYCRGTRCFYCSQTFTNMSTLHTHIGTCSQEKESRLHICTVCNNMYHTKSALRKHKLKHTGRTYDCKLCDKKYTDGHSLKIHLLKHEGRKPHICDTCGKQFTQGAHLWRHRKTHTGERGCICDVCGKSFIDRTGLNSHAITHQENRSCSFICEECGKSYTTRSGLFFHRRIHAGANRFHCNICKRTFTQKISLQRHMKKHQSHSNHGYFIEPTIFCNLCNKGFTNDRGWEKHLLKHKNGLLKSFNKQITYRSDNIGNQGKENKDNDAEDKEMSEVEDESSTIESNNTVAVNKTVDKSVRRKRVPKAVYLDNDSALTNTELPRLTIVEDTLVVGKTSENISNEFQSTGKAIYSSPATDSPHTGVGKMVAVQTSGAVSPGSQRTSCRYPWSLPAQLLTPQHDHTSTAGEDITKTANGNTAIRTFPVENVTKTVSGEHTVPYTPSREGVTKTVIPKNTVDYTQSVQISKRFNEKDITHSSYSGQQITEAVASESIPVVHSAPPTRKDIGRTLAGDHTMNSVPIQHITKTVTEHDCTERQPEEPQEKPNQDNVAKTLSGPYIMTTHSNSQDMQTTDHLNGNNTTQLAEHTVQLTGQRAPFVEHSNPFDRRFTEIKDKRNSAFTCTLNNHWGTVSSLQQNSDTNLVYSALTQSMCSDLPTAGFKTYTNLDSHGQPEISKKFSMVNKVDTCLLNKQGELTKESRQLVDTEAETINIPGTSYPVNSADLVQKAIASSVEKAAYTVDDFEITCIATDRELDQSGNAICVMTNHSNQPMEGEAIPMETYSNGNLFTEEKGMDGGNEFENFVESEYTRTGSDTNAGALTQINEETRHGLNFQVNKILAHEKDTGVDYGTDNNVYIGIADECDDEVKIHINKGQLLVEIAKENLICNICKAKFNCKYSLQRHLLEHKPTQELSDDTNAAEFQVYSETKSETARKKSGKGEQIEWRKFDIDKEGFRCKVCKDEVYASVKEMMVHLKSHKGPERKYICKKCPESFFTKWTLRIHKRSVHSNEIKRFICEVCAKSFDNKGHLHRHVLMHKKQISSFCPKCGKFFLDNNALKIHERSHVEKASFPCELCPKQFSTRSNLNRHKRSHVNGSVGVSRIAEFICSECDKTFTAKNSLQVHMLIHSGVRPYTCECGSAFTQASHLRRHKQLRHAEKAIKCDHCEKLFADKIALMVHLRSHTGSQPYKCDVCGRCFSQIQNMNTHKKMHSSTANFACSTCGQRFTTKMSMLRHCERHDREDKTNPKSENYNAEYSARCRQPVVKKMAEKNLLCPFCRKGFTTRRGFLAHHKTRCRGMRLPAQTADTTPAVGSSTITLLCDPDTNTIAQLTGSSEASFPVDQRSVLNTPTVNLAPKGVSYQSSNLQHHGPEHVVVGMLGTVGNMNFSHKMEESEHNGSGMVLPVSHSAVEVRRMDNLHEVWHATDLTL